MSTTQQIQAGPLSAAKSGFAKWGDNTVVPSKGKIESRRGFIKAHINSSKSSKRRNSSDLEREYNNGPPKIVSLMKRLLENERVGSYQEKAESLIGVNKFFQTETSWTERVFKKEGLTTELCYSASSPQKNASNSPFKINGSKDAQVAVIDTNYFRFSKIQNFEAPTNRSQNQSVEPRWILTKIDPSRTKSRHRGTESARSVSGLISRSLQGKSADRMPLAKHNQADWIRSREKEFQTSNTVLTNKVNAVKEQATNLKGLSEKPGQLVHRSFKHRKCVSSICQMLQADDHQPSEIEDSKRKIPIFHSRVSQEILDFQQAFVAKECKRSLSNINSFIEHANIANQQFQSIDEQSKSLEPRGRIPVVESEILKLEEFKKIQDRRIKAHMEHYKDKELSERTTFSGFLKSYEVNNSIKDTQLGGISERPLEQRTQDLIKLEIEHQTRKQIFSEYEIFRKSSVV
jgi:hypothetical protein